METMSAEVISIATIFGSRGVAGFFVSLVALVVAILSFILSKRANSAHSTRQAISEQYSEFKKFNELRIDNPQHSHIFEVPSHYEFVKSIVKRSAQDISNEESFRLVLQERAMAIMICSMYEATLYNIETAEMEGNKKRAKFLSEVLNYLEGEWLRNPRILYFWTDERHSLKTMFEIATRRRLEEKVLKYVAEEEIDKNGPFTKQT